MFNQILYLDEARCRISSLLKMLLPVLLLDFEGKTRTQDALQSHREIFSGGQQSIKSHTSCQMRWKHKCLYAGEC